MPPAGSWEVETGGGDGSGVCGDGRTECVFIARRRGSGRPGRWAFNATTVEGGGAADEAMGRGGGPQFTHHDALSAGDARFDHRRA